MRNLSPLGAIHSPIDADRDVSAYATDWKALGIPDHSPFDILSRPRAELKATTAPKKRGPKPRDCVAKTMAALRDNTADRFNTRILSREELDEANSVLNRGMA